MEVWGDVLFEGGEEETYEIGFQGVCLEVDVDELEVGVGGVLVEGGGVEAFGVFFGDFAS